MENIAQKFVREWDSLEPVSQERDLLCTQVAMLSECTTVGEIPELSNERVLYLIENADKVFKDLEHMRDIVSSLNLEEVKQLQRRRYCI